MVAAAAAEGGKADEGTAGAAAKEEGTAGMAVACTFAVVPDMRWFFSVELGTLLTAGAIIGWWPSIAKL